ncbi:MAG: hypothetical protein AAB353_14280 [Candidatus Hydrogenedentota bacterium]
MVVLDGQAELQDGTEVTIEVPQQGDTIQIHPDVKRFSGILPKNADSESAYFEGQAAKHR